MTLNRMLVIGNVGANPEMRYTASGKSVTSFTVASSEKYTKANGEKVEETVWFTVTCWDKLAENVNKYTHKGMLLYVEGHIKLDEWEGQDGKSRAKMTITATRVVFLSSKRDNTRESSKPAPPPDDDDDMPWN